MSESIIEFEDKQRKKLPDFTKTQLKSINRLFEPYLFFRSEKGKRVYECSCCNKTFEVSGKNNPLMKAKHNDKSTCPKCKTVATVKSSGQIKTGRGINESIYVAYLLPKSYNEVYIRCSCFKKDYSEDKINNMEEYIDSFYYITPEKSYEFDNEAFRWNKNTKAEDFYYRPRANDPFFFLEGTMGNYHKEYYMCTDKLEKCFLKYSGYREYVARRCYRPCKYLALYPEHPALEMMSKFGLDDYVDDLIAGKAHKSLINWKGKSGPEVFKCSKSEFNYIRREELPPECLKLYKKYKKYGLRLEDVEDIYIAVRYKFNISIGWLFSQKEITDVKKLVSYLQKQKNKLQGSFFIHLYIDYLNMARRLNYDLTDEVVLFPKDIKKAHDTAATVERNLIKEQEEKELREKELKAKELYDERVRKYEYSNGVFKIIVPPTLSSIVQEGQVQHNCVAGYVDRHANNKLCILFMRFCDRPEESFCTIEISTAGEVKQCLAKRNSEPPEEAKKFVEEWKSWMAEQKKKNKKAIEAA